MSGKPNTIPFPTSLSNLQVGLEDDDFELAHALHLSQQLTPNKTSDTTVYTDEELARILQEQEEQMLASSFVDAPPQVKPSFNSVIPPEIVDIKTDEELARKLQEEERKNTRYRGPTIEPYRLFEMLHAQPNRSRFSHHHRHFSESEEDLSDSDSVDEMSYEQLLELGEKIGNVEKGVTKSKLSSLPTRKFNKENSKGDTSCSVCQMDYEDGEKLRSLPCIHSFHQACIDKWLSKKKTCPICLKEVK